MANKNIFYIATSKLISENHEDIFNTKYGIGILITDQENIYFYKIGATNNIETHLAFHKAHEIKDLEVLYTIETNDPEELCQNIISYYDKSDNDSFGNKHFWGTTEFYEELVETVNILNK